MEEFVQTANINEKWLENIYENIKKLEDYERLVREGCQSLLDFMNIPERNRPIVIGLTQFKNLRFMITEFTLLLADLTPILEEPDKYDKVLNDIDEALKLERLFLKTMTNVDNEITEVRPTEFFYQTLKTLHNLKRDLFKEIKHILYINTKNEF